jgi:hypothetical protein
LQQLSSSSIGNTNFQDSADQIDAVARILKRTLADFSLKTTMLHYNETMRKREDGEKEGDGGERGDREGGDKEVLYI